MTAKKALIMAVSTAVTPPPPYLASSAKELEDERPNYLELLSSVEHSVDLEGPEEETRCNARHKYYATALIIIC